MIIKMYPDILYLVKIITFHILHCQTVGSLTRPSGMHVLQAVPVIWCHHAIWRFVVVT